MMSTIATNVVIQIQEKYQSNSGRNFILKDITRHIFKIMAKEGNIKEKEEEPRRGKLSYDELNSAATQLYSQLQTAREENRKLTEQLKIFQANEYYVRLEWLWKVITTKDVKLPDKFLKARIAEFIDLMTPVENKDGKEASDSEKQSV